jgi:hypothetical protein
MGGTNEDHTELTRAVLMPLDGTTPTSVATNSLEIPRNRGGMHYEE